MATFYEIKNFICKLFRHDDIEDSDENIDLTFSDRLNNQYNFCLENDQLKNIYNSVFNTKNEEMELVLNQRYEIAINIDRPMLLRRCAPIKAEDQENNITYEIGYCSIEYCIYILNKWIDMSPKRGHRINIPFRMRMSVNNRFSIDEDIEVNWMNALIYALRIWTLKIFHLNPLDIENIRKNKTAFSFEFMYKTGVALLEYNDLNDMFSMKLMDRSHFNPDNLENPPHREYINDVIDYYRLAMGSRDPYIQFISFYHIIEYFYDEVFKQRIIDDLKRKLTQPDFSYKNKEKLYELVTLVRHRIKMNDELGRGNESESLRFVLEKFIIISDLKTKLKEMSEDIVLYYQNNKVPFCKAPTIQWNESDHVYGNLSKRIYYVRNALIHSKSGKNDERYKPYKDEEPLKKEIPLIKAIAEMVIISSSKIV